MTVNEVNKVCLMIFNVHGRNPDAVRNSIQRLMRYLPEADWKHEMKLLAEVYCAPWASEVESYEAIPIESGEE